MDFGSNSYSNRVGVFARTRLLYAEKVIMVIFGIFCKQKLRFHFGFFETIWLIYIRLLFTNYIFWFFSFFVYRVDPTKESTPAKKSAGLDSLDPTDRTNNSFEVNINQFSNFSCNVSESQFFSPIWIRSEKPIYRNKLNKYYFSKNALTSHCLNK